MTGGLPIASAPAMHAVMPLMANTVEVLPTLAGRTTPPSAAGWRLFSLRLAALTGRLRSGRVRAGSGTCNGKPSPKLPRTRYGWLMVNNSRGRNNQATRTDGDVITYTHHPVYSAACVCYLLLGRVAGKRNPDFAVSGEAQRTRPVRYHMTWVWFASDESTIKIAGLGIDCAIRRLGCAGRSPLLGADIAALGMRGQTHHRCDPTHD